MAKPQFLSPSAISMYYKNPEEYYVTYMTSVRPERIPQTKPMSVGSAFDAYAKSHLHQQLFGAGNDPKFKFETIFESQVEPHNRDYAKVAGKICWEQYYASGALADLMIELQNSAVTPRFEFEISGVIDGKREGVTRDIGGVPLKGKPDVFFVNKLGAHVIFDWKVNGYDSKYGASPMKGFVRLREMGYNVGSHKEAVTQSYKGMLINIAGTLDQFNIEWARQLGIYAWLIGEDIGSDFVVAVDQIVCRPTGIRFAEHRLKIAAEAQWKLFASAQYLWELINSDHFFRDLSLEESQRKCEDLNKRAILLTDPDGNPNEKWFASMTRVI